MRQALITGGLAMIAAIIAATFTLLITGPGGGEAATASAQPLSAPTASDVTEVDSGEHVAMVQASNSEVYTPARGSAERSALMDALRPIVEPELGPDVIFVISDLKVKDDWAFGVLEPVRRDGSPLDIDSTPIAVSLGGAEFLDGLRTEAIWRKTSRGWRVEAHGIGATDVWYEPYCDEAPAGLIAACAARPSEASLPVSGAGNVGGMNRASIDRLTTYAVLLGRGIGCGIETRHQMARVGAWLDRVAPPGSSDQQIYLPMFMAGVEQNARAQSQGRSPDNCNTVARAISQHPWP